MGTELWLAPGGLADQVAKAQGKTREEVLEATGKGVPKLPIRIESMLTARTRSSSPA